MTPVHDVDHRMGEGTVTVTDGGGVPLADAVITVEQTRHDFAFGNIGFDLIEWIGGDGEAGTHLFGGASAASAPLLAEKYLELYNATTLPFYWRGFEPRQGAPDTDRLRRAAQWFVDRGVAVKGHPLLWHTLAPEWLLDLDDVAAESVMRARITRETRAFAGVVDLWDAINEAVILPVFTAEHNAVTRLAQSKGRIEMVRLAFESAREGNPHARLVLNDFDLSADYERLIEECLDAGIEIDAIGLQTHMHQGYRGEEAVWDILERFARFGLPLQMTETTLVSGDLMPAHIVDLNDYVVDDWPSTPEGEARQADEVVRHYRTLVSHPAVESITYWGLTDEGAWLGAPAGLLRRDGTAKPAFDALVGLIKSEWWTHPTDMRTDADGRVHVRGFAGDYRVSHGGRSAELHLERGATAPLRVALE
ncbi:endo-1,4-beta-xylanase [Demequina muriae]|uniref:Beta-xylanase n=1 Tax=Demequina muriae TaxID=3051664 RepID=A0ABT8GIH5_9MICO|nr:endo-1,4-beta-xylanase [Demequina sp. EGI L300058]MDN4481215.1 endo-1,4-beta-xylanase [Demequina sp. EGI L300058]